MRRVKPTAAKRTAVARKREAIWQELDLPSEPETPVADARIADALLKLYCESLRLTLHALDEAAVEALLARGWAS